MSIRVIGSNYYSGSELVDFTIFGGGDIVLRGKTGGIKVYKKDRDIYIVYVLGGQYSTVIITPNNTSRSSLPNDATEMSITPY